MNTGPLRLKEKEWTNAELSKLASHYLAPLPCGPDDPRTESGREHIRRSLRRLRDLVTPALDAFADGKTNAPEFEKLNFAFADLRGQPFRFERELVNGKETDKWERVIGRRVDVNSLYDHYIALLAGLFDADKLDDLARCQHCGEFFVTAGRGKPVKWAPGHGNDIGNEKLRQEGYFKDRYQERVKDALKRARQLRRKGLRGQALLERLKEEKTRYIGKTLLKRNALC